jgi:superoxide reductase
MKGMCKNQKFFRCKMCGKIIGIIEDTGVPTICCGQEMYELIPNTEDASTEKHVPKVTVEGNIVTVEVGSAPHPMIPEHYIQWIYLLTEHGGQRKCLTPDDEPKAIFALAEGDKALSAFEYCNLHGLWKADI